MAKEERTFKINKAIEMANEILAKATLPGEEGRRLREGVIALLERILFDSEVYCGYRCLEQHEVPAGEKPGIIEFENPYKFPEFPDGTRVQYFKT